MIGASNFDVGHIGLGNPGGGVASLGVVGGNNKAQGCTGLSTPVGDFFAVDYVAHEIGHQFAGNHTFNGTQSNCSGGNRSAANSFEPGSGSSIMAYAGICQQDNLQPHSDPYWSHRSFTEITALVTGDRPPINEVQNVSLTDFSGGNETQSFQLTGFGGTDSFQLEYQGNLSAPIVNGTNYNAAGIQAAIEGIAGWPAGATLTITGIGGAGAPAAAGFDVAFGGTLANTDVSTFAVVNGVGVTGIVSTPFNGGPTADSFTLNYEGTNSVPIVNDSNYSAAGIAAALQGLSEVQTVSLTGYDADGDSFTLNYNGVDSVPIVRGQNNTTAGIQNALQGGNEQQQAILTGFNGATQSFQIELGGNLSAVLGSGGLAISNANVAAAVNAIPGFAGTVTSANAGNTGFTLTFAGASAGIDVPSISIVNCTGGCTSSVRELAKGGGPIAGWPAGGTVAVGGLSDAGFTLTFGGGHQGTDVAPLSVTNGVGGVSGTVAETVKGTAGILPPGATATVAAFGAAGNFNDFGFQVTFGGTLGLVNVSQLALTNVNGFTGYVGETAKGGPIDNKGWVIEVTDNHAPVVTTPTEYTIPLRTPFALTGSATDFDGDTLTYMWEQNDRGGATGTALVNNIKTNGPLFRQFGTAANVSATDTLLSPSPGLNAVDGNPTRVFPDLAQILANNTNAVTGTCPAGPPAPTPLPPDVRDCFSEFLPTADWVGFLGDRTLNFKLTARDGNPGAGGLGSADTRLVLAPTAGPFLVTSHGAPGAITGGSAQTVTWDVAGTNRRSGEHGRGEDQPLHRRRGHLPARPRRRDSERRVAVGDDPEHGDHEGPDQGGGRRKRLLRHLRRRRHDPGRPGRHDHGPVGPVQRRHLPAGRRLGHRRGLAGLGAQRLGHRSPGGPVALGRLDLERLDAPGDAELDARRHHDGGARCLSRLGHRHGRHGRLDHGRAHHHGDEGGRDPDLRGRRARVRGPGRIRFGAAPGDGARQRGRPGLGRRRAR